MTQHLVEETDELHERIVTGVAALEDTDPQELPPLFGAVDPDALEAIFADPRGDGARVGTVSFPYAGYTVTVEIDDDRTVTIE